MFLRRWTRRDWRWKIKLAVIYYDEFFGLCAGCERRRMKLAEHFWSISWALCGLNCKGVVTVSKAAHYVCGVFILLPPYKSAAWLVEGTCLCGWAQADYSIRRQVFSNLTTVIQVLLRQSIQPCQISMENLLSISKTDLKCSAMVSYTYPFCSCPS